MSAACPEGHLSQSTDYCDVCGTPMGASGGSAPASSGPAAAAPSPTTCPHCGSPAASAALFCENCGYDFTTGATPVVAPAGGTSSFDLGPAGAAPTAGPTTGATPSVGAASGAGAATGATPVVGAPSAPATGATPVVGAGPDPLEPPPAVAVPSGTSPVPDPAAPLTPPPPGADAWVAELWVDPDWYAAQQAEDPMPSVGLPVLVPLRERSVLVGRPSASRNIRPQIDAGADSGVSRRHCQLNTDGHRWWVEDLQSSNGTFVARVGESLPDTPIRPGQRHELQDGDRLYLGSWTRLVVRRALPGEV